MQEEYYTINEATKYLGVSPATIERLVRRKVLKKYRRQIDQRTYYKKSELDEAKTFHPDEQEKG